MAPTRVPVARDVDPGDHASGADPLVLSRQSCRRCGGYGVVRTRRGHRTCACVYRRGAFFHAVYRAEGLFGAAIINSHPYSLFPPSEYFAGFTIPATSLAASGIRPR